MGTGWEISLWDSIPERRFNELKAEIIKMTDDFDRTYSRFKADSLVSRISKGQGLYDVPQDFMAMLKMYFDLYLPARKKLNPLVGATLSDLGYDAEYSLTPKPVIHRTPDLLETVRVLNEGQIETSEPVLFDFGALGKGYAVDKISDFLKKQKIEKFLVNGSGDIYYRGPDKIRVGLEDPEDTQKVIAAAEVPEGAMCASGTNRRRWRNLHHVIDPQTSLPTVGLLATWVIAKNTALSDALASCLFFVEPEALSRFDFEYCLLNESRQVKRSPRFNAEFFS